ncbi:Mid1p [Sporobolomyces salmoneus]|uniref:Mid1p n=1 Tax=Sporobolomyces salmoneus TaxID=183962 RepID=UPI00316BA173
MIDRIARPLYRRRPPNLILFLFSLLSLLSFTASAQPLPLSLPYSSSFDVISGQTSYFELPPTNDEQLYFTLSLCSPPEDLADSPLPTHLNTTLYVSTTPDIQQPGPDNAPSKARGEGATSKLEFGAANVTLFGEGTDGVWVGVTAPDDAELGGDGDGVWTFELDVTNDAPLVLLDGGASFHFHDSDQSTALLTTANWTDGSPQPSAYTPVYYSIISPSTPLSYSLGRSRCFVRSQSNVPERNIEASETTRGYGGGTRSQFAVSDLPGGANYTAWLVQNLTEVSNSTNATRLWDPIFFTTKSTSSCRLLYGLDFCPSVAYSVPAPLSLPTSDLVDYFNSTISPSLAAFARTLTTFPCNSTKFGQYSVVSTCTDCYEAYRDWICATTIPRCTDAPPNITTLVPSNSSLFDPEMDLATWSIPPHYSDTLIRDYPPASRTPSFAPSNLSTTFPDLFNSSYPSNRRNSLEQSPFPYSEVPPCMDACHLVDARCPSFLKWSCPTSGDTGRAVYGMTEQVGRRERIAGDVRHSSRTERAQDRWGNVYCNALGSDLKMAVQFVSISSSASSLLPSSLFVVISILSSVFVLDFLSALD